MLSSLLSGTNFYLLPIEWGYSLLTLGIKRKKKVLSKLVTQEQCPYMLPS